LTLVLTVLLQGHPHLGHLRPQGVNGGLQIDPTLNARGCNGGSGGSTSGDFGLLGPGQYLLRKLTETFSLLGIKLAKPTQGIGQQVFGLFIDGLR
jgi:hypothetical protein